MTRVKRGVAAHKRHKKIIKAAKGYRGLRNRTFKQAKTAWMKAGENAYRDRKGKKRVFRKLWITRLSAACKAEGTNYSRFIEGLTKKAILLDRKILSGLAITDPEVFKKLVEEAKDGVENGGIAGVNREAGGVKKPAAKTAKEENKEAAPKKTVKKEKAATKKEDKAPSEEATTDV